MTNEILAALRKEGFKSRLGENGVDFDLYDGLRLCVWARDTWMTVSLLDTDTGAEIHLSNLSPIDASIEDVDKIVRLKNLLYVADKVV